MKAHFGNLDARFVYQGDLSGATGVTPGNGLTPAKPFAEHGGDLKFLIDVDVPAVVAGTSVDWSITYPAQYTTPQPIFDLLRYAEPIDTSKKLHGRGNLWIYKAAVFQGTGLTGAVQPTQGGGTMAIAIRTSGTLTNIWDYSGAIQTGQKVLVPSNEKTSGVYIGTDVADDTLSMTITATTNGIVAGRYRVILLACEI